MIELDVRPGEQLLPRPRTPVVGRLAVTDLQGHRMLEPARVTRVERCHQLAARHDHRDATLPTRPYAFSVRPGDGETASQIAS